MQSMGSSESSEKVNLEQFTVKYVTPCKAHGGIMSDLCPVSCPTEGVRRLFSGASMASSRGAMVTVGQASHNTGSFVGLFGITGIKFVRFLNTCRY